MCEKIMVNHGGSTMQAMEFSKGRDAALGITVAPDSVDAFVAEFRNVKAALLAWKAKHQDHCKRVMFTIVSAPDNHEAIEAVLKQVYEGEQDLSPLLKSVEVEVALLNASGKPVKEYSLGGPRFQETQQTKPWWKFW
jgi:hypothetical protein